MSETSSNPPGDLVASAKLSKDVETLMEALPASQRSNSRVNPPRSAAAQIHLLNKMTLMRHEWVGECVCEGMRERERGREREREIPLKRYKTWIAITRWRHSAFPVWLLKPTWPDWSQQKLFRCLKTYRTFLGKIWITPSVELEINLDKARLQIPTTGTIKGLLSPSVFAQQSLRGFGDINNLQINIFEHWS